MASDQKQTTVVLMVDTSNSMAATDVHPSRIQAARTAAQDLINGLPKTAKVGIVSFARDVHVALAPTADRNAIKGSLQRLTLSGGTALGPAIDHALASLQASHSQVKGRAIVVISDGKSTEGTRSPLAAAKAAKAAGSACLHCLSRHLRRHRQGSRKTVNVPPDPTTLKRVAAATGGRFFRAADATSLHNAYRTLAARSSPSTRSATSASPSWPPPPCWCSVAACSRWPGSAA